MAAALAFRPVASSDTFFTAIPTPPTVIDVDIGIGTGLVCSRGSPLFAMEIDEVAVSEEQDGGGVRGSDNCRFIF